MQRIWKAIRRIVSADNPLEDLRLSFGQSPSPAQFFETKFSSPWLSSVCPLCSVIRQNSSSLLARVLIALHQSVASCRSVLKLGLSSLPEHSCRFSHYPPSRCIFSWLSWLLKDRGFEVEDSHQSIFISMPLLSIAHSDIFISATGLRWDVFI